MTGGNLAEFRQGLDEWLKDDAHLRPFVCDGSPLECRVFLVGFNAAKRLEKPFDTYWSDTNGFLKGRFQDDYLQERGLQAPIGTRARIEKFVEAAKPVKCLETNIHAKPSAAKRQLARMNRVTGVFEYLLNTIRPSVIVAYSKEPIEFFRINTGRSDFLDGFVAVSLNGHSFKLLGIEKHLAYVGFEKAAKAGMMAGREAHNEP